MPYFFADPSPATGAQAGGDRPAAGDIIVAGDSRSVTGGRSVTLSPIANDSASDGSPLFLASVGELDGGGTITQAGNNVTFLAPGDFTGVVTCDYTVGSSNGAVATGTMSFAVTAPAVVVPTDPVDTTINPLTFYKRGWGAGATKDPASGHRWNVGCFATTSSVGSPVPTYLQFPVRMNGGLCFNIKTGTSANTTRTWDQQCGGPLGNGPRVILDKSQAAVHLHGGTRAWVRKEQNMGAGTWGYFAITPMPLGGTWADVKAVIASTGPGKGRYNELSMLGARMRYLIDLHRGNNTDYLYTLGRWAYEFNQDTGLQLTLPNGTLGGYFQDPNATLSNWREFLSAGIQAFWDGFGYKMPMAMSPAFESNSIPALAKFRYDNIVGSEGYPNYLDFLVPETIICCGSYHPIPKRVQTAAAARLTTYGTYPADNYRRYTPKVVLDAARSTGRCAAFLEHSVAMDNPLFYNGDLTHAVAAYKHFGKICNDNGDIMAFTGLLGSHMCDESGSRFKAKNIEYGLPPPTAAELATWARLCRAYRDGFTTNDGSAYDNKRTLGFGKVLP